MDIVGDVFEVLHVSPDDHIAEGEEVAVTDIVHFHDSPRVLPTAN